MQIDEIKQLRKQGGRWLKTLRDEAELSQSDLAQRLGFDSYDFISQLENGRGRIPPERYADWADALGAPLMSFVTRLMRFYDPITFQILFEGQASRPDGFAKLDAEKARLRLQVREFHQLLGKASIALERLKEDVDS